MIMQEGDLEYAKMVATIKPYTDKGRPISIAFLNWFLEHIYRLDQVAAEDTICDKSNDRGIDGIYVDENQAEIHVLQSKTKQNGTIGDKDLREFSGTLNQIRTTDALDAFLAGKVDQEIKDKIQKLGLRGLLEKGFSLRGVFVTNVPIDANGVDVIKADPSIIGYDRTAIVRNYVDLNVEGGVKQKLHILDRWNAISVPSWNLGKSPRSFRRWKRTRRNARNRRWITFRVERPPPIGQH
jgi:hypothetical protein